MTTPDPDETSEPANLPATSDAVSPDEVSDGPGMPDLGGLDLGNLDLGGLFEQAAAMQQQMAAAQAQVAATTVEGVAGGGAVRVKASGAGIFLAVTIQPEAVDPNDVEMLQDLVLAALHDATVQITELQQGGMGGLDIGGLDLGGLLGGA